MKSALRWFAARVTAVIPPTRGYALKRLIWRCAGVEVGHGVRLVSTARFVGPGRISVGADTFIGHEALVIATNEVRIGSRCDLAPRVLIADGTHAVGRHERRAGPGRAEPVSVGDGTWIGAGAILTAGSTVGSGVIIAAGAVVTTRSEGQDDVLLAGVPATARRRLDGPEP